MFLWEQVPTHLSHHHHFQGLINSARRPVTSPEPRARLQPMFWLPGVDGGNLDFGLTCKGHRSLKTNVLWHQTINGGSREEIRPWPPSSLAKDSPSNEEINVDPPLQTVEPMWSKWSRTSFSDGQHIDYNSLMHHMLFRLLGFWGSIFV